MKRISLVTILAVLAFFLLFVTGCGDNGNGGGLPELSVEDCQTDARALQTAVVAFYFQAGKWPTLTGQGSDMIDWYAWDGTHSFVPSYILEVPYSDFLGRKER